MDDVGGIEERRRLQFAYRQDIDRDLDGLEEYGEGTSGPTGQKMLYIRGEKFSWLYTKVHRICTEKILPYYSPTHLRAMIRTHRRYRGPHLAQITCPRAGDVISRPFEDSALRYARVQCKSQSYMLH